MLATLVFTTAIIGSVIFSAAVGFSLFIIRPAVAALDTIEVLRYE